MKFPSPSLALYLLASISFSQPTLAWSLASLSSAANPPGQPNRPSMLANEPAANSVAIPKQILHTGVNIFSSDVSPNSRQLADSLGLITIFKQINILRARVAQSSSQPSLENIAARQDLSELLNHADQIILEADLQVDFVLAQISAEQNIYTDVLSSYQGDRDRVVARANSASYYANGVLWAVGEGFDIPTYRVPKYSIPSGTVSILAGLCRRPFHFMPCANSTARKQTPKLRLTCSPKSLITPPHLTLNTQQ